MTVEDFWKDDFATNFIDRISAFMNIPTNKLRIVGFKNLPTGGARRQLSSGIDL